MHRHNTGGGDLPTGGALHRMGSPPPPGQSGPLSGITSPEPHPQSPPSFSPQTHPLQQFLMGTPLQGININLRGQPVLHTRISPTAVSPGVLPVQTGSTSPLGYQQQLSPQAMGRQLHPSTQAFLQMSCLQGQAITTSGVNPLQRPVMNVPLSPGRSFVDPATGIPVHQVNISPSSSVQQQTSNNPFVFQDVHRSFPDTGESQISQESLLVQNLLMPSQQPMGTIHHLGQGSPGRSSMPPLSSPTHTSGSPRRSSSHSPTRGAPGHKSPTGGGYRRPHSPARTSPLPSSPSLVMRKTMMPQTEERPPANAEVAELRRQVLQERLTDIKKLKETYNDKLTELFFLQNGGNMMDFLTWKKRPNQQLFVYLSSHQMEDEEEKTINDEVKVITNSGSNIPVGTPVAISTQLPPAVSALSSQLNQKAREQKAREMRRSLPGTVQVAAAAAAAGSAANLGDGEASRKRSLSQAGLDVGAAGQDKKVQLMQSSHEPNVTVTPSMMTAIPSLPGTNDALSKQQQQQSQQQAQQQQSSKMHEPSTPTRVPGHQSLAVPRNVQPAKSPPATHSLHSLKLSSPSSASSTPTSSSTQGTPAPRKTPTLSAVTPNASGTPSATPSPNRTLKPTPLSPTAQQRLATRQQSLSAVYDYTIGSQEMIVEKAKQEAQVMQRVAELRKEGLWAAKRLPKVQEPPRQKTHWDYLLEEMQWLATDFAQERRWKRASARKLVRAVARHHQEQHAKEVKAEKEESQKLKKIAGNMAKEIMTFWANIEKVVQYKQQSRLEERRKKVMDLQLDYIVGQTEKYSSWLTEGLNLATSSTTTSVQGSMPSSPRSEGDTSVITGDDVDFQPVGDDSDDEETIDVEEKADEEDADARAKEIELLQKESELPLEDLLSSLPPGMLDKPGSSSEGGEKARAEKEEGKSGARRRADEETSLKAVTEDVKEEGESKQDEEFMLSADEDDEKAQDEEDTLEEQEAAEGSVDHRAEIAELQADGDLPIEELMKRYAGAYEDEYEYPGTEESEEEEEEDSMEDSETEEEELLGTDEEEEELADIGMEYLINPEKVAEEPKPSKQTGKGEPNKEITDIAAAAQSLQPTGYTLSTTQVKTKVPFLLRHKLREYQHIGLDWMVTLHEKKLNGILADEMGLGKTIQTIALFAHLACEEENWGPHLIVVPTSVMLNWEMELKKWSPGFKILTYYGNQKERKQKRQGWTKCNAFHVCITSYKLVIQDHQSFRRKKWKYLVLDEAQNIKNFKSQRWQTLLNFNSQRRLLLTGTPLQNNLMELWSLMHFLMPHVFASHREFREWFSNPLSGMIEGTQEYNESLIRRLHKVLRPFLLRRLKSEVEKQLPQKYEHVVRCRLSKRQRFLYEDFMSRARTKETLASGHFMSVINVLMQLRKVCNHPDLFESRPIFSPLQMEGINFYTASLALRALEYDPFKHVNLNALNLCIAEIEMFLPAYAAHRIRKLQAPRKLIEEIDSSADTPPKLPKLKVKPGKLFTPVPAAVQAQPKEGRASPLILSSGRASPMQQGSASSPVLLRTQTQGTGGRSSPVVTQFLVRSPSGTQLLRQTNTPPGTPVSVSGVTTLQLTGTSTPGTFTLVSSSQSPVVPGATPLQQLPGYTGATTTTSATSSATSLASVVQQRLVLQQQIGAVSGSGNRAQFVTSQPITLQLQNRGQQGARIAIPASQLQLQSQSGGIVRIVQTPSGQQIVRQAAQTSVISQQTLLQQQQLLQLRQQQQQQRQLQQVALQSAVAGGQQVTVNSQQLVNSVMSPAARTQVTVQPTQTNQVTNQVAAATPQLARIQQPQLSAVAQVQNALQQQQQQQFLQQLQQQQLKLQQPAQTTTAQTSSTQVVSVSAGLAQTMTSTAAVASSAAVNQTDSKPAQSIPKLQTVATTSGARTTTTPSKTYSTAAARKAKREAAKKSHFYLESIEHRRDDDRKATLQRIATVNKTRCMAKPVYGQDLFSAVNIYNGAPPAGGSNPLASGIGHVFSQCVQLLGDSGKGQSDQYTDALRQLIHSPEDILANLQEIIKRYAIVVPLAEAPPITLHTSHPPPSFLTDREHLTTTLTSAIKPRMKCLHRLQIASKFQFPELRLIQYDCGKLQALAVLLCKLKLGSHRVLIFTQMTKMLDVLERFLNYYGYIYLRLDGATRVEQRQVLMERFNADPRIFVFILSTRSGGVGVNLTGADTVIFYDSDWNPTMDAQAQDRCHRIGQTRDVHIYRLVSEMTVEENILKKANQKRLLVDVSIEGGNFTTAFFRERTIKELFDLSTTGNMNTATELVVEDLKASSTPVATPPQGDATTAATAKNNLTKEQLEQALARTEDETDVQAASKAHAEQDAELAEFDEDIPYEGEESKTKEEPSKVELELAQLDEQLTPIEKYAMTFLECTMEHVALEELKEAEEQIEEAKKEWELSRLKAIKEEEERRAELEEDEILYTYAREDAQNQVLKNKQAKGKKNRASSRISQTPSSAEKRATRSAEPKTSTRSTRSNASSPVLRSRNASPEGPRVTSPLRSGPGSPTRTKVASPERSITLRSDRGRLRSSDEPLSPPLPPQPPVSTSAVGAPAITARSRRASSSSASESAKSPPYNAVPSHGWGTRSKRKSTDIEFVDIRVVEKRARAAAVAAAAEKNVPPQQQPRVEKMENKPEIEAVGNETSKKESSPVHVNSSQEVNHEETTESILENIQKLTATIENELMKEPPINRTEPKQVANDDVSVVNQTLPDVDGMNSVVKHDRTVEKTVTTGPKVRPPQVMQVSTAAGVTVSEVKPANSSGVHKTQAVILNVPKFSPPPSATMALSPLQQLATVVSTVTNKLPAHEQPMDLCVNNSNSQPMDLGAKSTLDIPVDLSTKPTASLPSTPERPRTPIFEKMQSESPTSSPKLPSSPKMPPAAESNVFERMRFPIPMKVGHPVSVPPLFKSVPKERLGLFEKMKSAFSITKSASPSIVKKVTLQETTTVVKHPDKCDATTPPVHFPDDSHNAVDNGTSESEVQMEESHENSADVDNEVAVQVEQDTKEEDSKESSLDQERPKSPSDLKSTQIPQVAPVTDRKETASVETLESVPEAEAKVASLPDDGGQKEETNVKLVNDSCQVVDEVTPQTCESHVSQNDLNNESQVAQKQGEDTSDVQPVGQESEAVQDVPEKDGEEEEGLQEVQEENADSEIHPAADASKETTVTTDGLSNTPTCASIDKQQMASISVTTPPAATTESVSASISVTTPPAATAESVSAVARLHMIKSLSPDAVHSVTSTRSKSPSPDRSSRSPVFDVPMASSLLSGSPTPDHPLTAGVDTPKFSGLLKTQEKARNTAAVLEKPREDQACILKQQERDNSTSSVQNVQVDTSKVQQPDKGANDEQQPSKHKSEMLTPPEETVTDTKESTTHDASSIQPSEEELRPSKLSAETAKPCEPELDSHTPLHLDVGDMTAPALKSKPSAETTKPCKPEVDSQTPLHLGVGDIAAPPCEPEVDSQTPLHLDVGDIAAPALMKQSPGTKPRNVEGELEMPQISPMFKITSPPKEKSPVKVTSEGDVDNQSPTLTSVSTTLDHAEEETQNVALEVKEKESIDSIKNKLAIAEGKREAVDNKNAPVVVNELSTNHVDNEKKDDINETSSDNESSSSEDDAPRTTRAKTALLAAQQRRQLRSEGRGSLMQPLSFKPTVHMGRVIRGKSRERNHSRSNTSQSDSSPSPIKRGIPPKSLKTPVTDSDSSPQGSPTKRGRGRPRKYPKLGSGKSPEDSEKSPEEKRGRGRPRKYLGSDGKSPKDKVISTNVGASHARKQRETDSDSSVQGNTHQSRHSSHKYSSPDNALSGIDKRTEGRTRSKSAATNSPSTDEPELGARRTRSRNNSTATSHGSSRSSSAANSRDASPARPDVNMVNRQRRLSGRNRNSRS